MDMLTPKQKMIAYAVMVLAVLASTFAGILLNRVTITTLALSVSQTANTALVKERDEARQALTESESRWSQKAQTYEKRIAALDAKGNPALDGKGLPIFNVELGSMTQSEQVNLMKTSYESKLTEKDSKFEQLSREMQELKTKTTKPGLRPITLMVAYEFEDLKDFAGGRWAPGMGYNFQLGPWTWTAGAELALPQGTLGLGYRAVLQVQP